MIRLVALDVDDTLTETDGSVAPEAVRAVRGLRSAGANVALISSRPPEGVATVRRALHVDAAVVSYAGALIQDDSGNTLRLTLMRAESAWQLAEYADRKHYSLTLAVPGREYHTLGERRPAMTPVISVGSARATVAHIGPPILMGAGGSPASQDLYAYARESLAATVSASRYLSPDPPGPTVTFVDAAATKGAALELLMQRLGVDSSSTLAIGDSEVDLSMLAVAGLGAAVANGSKEVRAVADLVAPLARGQGVAWILDRVRTGRADAFPRRPGP